MVTGRPPIFNTVEEFEKKVEEYFEYIKGEYTIEEKKDEQGNMYDHRTYTRHPEPQTITGLCLFLGFESRQSYHDYAKKTDFSYAFKKARLRIEKNYEEHLFSKNPTGPIFALKNMGWSDRQEIDQRTTIEDNRIDPSKLTDDELRTLAEIQRKSGVSKA